MALGAITLRRLALTVGVMILAVAGFWAWPRSSAIPSGWDRDDYIAYRMLSDVLGEMSKNGMGIRVACVSNDVGRQGGPHDPSRHLMETLAQDIAGSTHAMTLKPASRCHLWEGIVRDETGADAFYLYARHDMTFGYLAGTHHAPLSGAALTYRVDFDRSPPIFDRGDWVSE